MLCFDDTKIELFGLNSYFPYSIAAHHPTLYGEA